MATDNPWDEFPVAGGGAPSGSSAPSNGPIYGPPPVPEKTPVPSPKDIWHPMTPEEIGATPGLDPKGHYLRSGAGDIKPLPVQKNTAAQAQALQAYGGVTSKIDGQIKRIDQLLGHPGLTLITGPIQGRFSTGMDTAIGTVEHLFGAEPRGTDAESAQALIDQIGSAATIAELQDMRANSKTGGAVGNVSNYEDKMLRNAATRLRQSQSTADFKAALEDYKQELSATKRRLYDAYVNDYGSPPSGSGSAPAGGGHPADIDAIMKKYGVHK